MELECKLIEKHEVVQVGKNNSDKLGFVVKTKGKYPKDVFIETFNADCIMFINDTDNGAELLVQIEPQSRKWTSPKGEVKWFSSINAWKAEVSSSGGYTSAPLTNNTPIEQATEENDPLPF